MTSAPAPGVSILMVMKNERRNVERVLPRILEQDYPGPVEIIYVDSGSTDGTIEFMRDLGIEAHVIAPKDFHHGRTRNYAASLAKNEILVILSGDAVPLDAQWLRNLVAPFADPEVGAVYGRQIPPPEIGPLRARYLSSEYPEERQVRNRRTAPAIHPGLFRFSNANAAVRRSVWQRFPWSEAVTLAEDQGLCRDVFMAGMTVIYEPAAAVIHGHERNLWGEFQFATDNGISLTRLGILNNPEIGGELGYGIKRMLKDFRHFLHRGQFLLAFRSLLSSAVKWLGIQIGKRDRLLPHALLRRISEVHRKTAQ